MACAKAAEEFELKTGPYQGQKVLVDGPEYENAGGCANMGCFDPQFVLEWNFYCDTYGIDTISFSTCMAFVMEAFEAGVITARREGRYVFYRLENPAVLELVRQAMCLAGQSPEELALAQRTAAQGCNCPNCAPVAEAETAQICSGQNA